MAKGSPSFPDYSFPSNVGAKGDLDLADRHRVTCINKTNRPDSHERIRRIGGNNADASPWRLDQPEAINGIESGKWSFYVERPVGDAVDVVVAVSRYGNKYLKTTADGDQPNNLLALPECT